MTRNVLTTILQRTLECHVKNKGQTEKHKQKKNKQYTHTHTHTHIYTYIYVYTKVNITPAAMEIGSSNWYTHILQRKLVMKNILTMNFCF